MINLGKHFVKEAPIDVRRSKTAFLCSIVGIMNDVLNGVPGDSCDGEVPDPLSRAVQELFGLSYLFPYQRLVMANILEAAEASGIRVRWPGEVRGDAAGMALPPEESLASDREHLGRQIVILPTGAGKSLCFQLPAMLMEGPTLVIYPLLALMADQERRLKERGFFPVILRGGQTGEEREAVWEKIRSGESKCIIANPEVLLTPPVLVRLKSLNIVHVVIDEAHCVSEWGETFRPAYREIHKIIDAARPPVVTAFTATAGAPVLEKIENYIFGSAAAGSAAVRRIIGNPDRKNITYTARGCILRDLAVRDLLLANRRPAIVFCSSRPGTEKLARYLRNELFCHGADWYGEIRFYHAGLGREEKKDIESWFLRNERAVLTATCAFGLGIDKADIRTVIHRDCPPSVEAYLQESGRAGRDGLQSKAILLWGPEDQNSLQRAASEGERRRLERLLDYARDINHCRREALLRLLDYGDDDERPESPCCDVCEREASGELREESSVTGFFRRNKRAYTINGAASLLARAENIRWSEEDAAGVIKYLLGEGKLKKLGAPLWKNKITCSSKPPGSGTRLGFNPP